MNTFSYDFETEYSDEISISTMGVAKYIRTTDIYLVGIYGDDFCWVGEPQNAPWGVLEGQRVVAHNNMFDMAVSKELCRRGLAIPKFGYEACTANLAAYLQSPRNLAGASKQLLGVELDKGMRSWAKGKKWAQMPADRKQEMARYTALDAKASWMLWNQHSSKWPDSEQYISQHTTEMCHRGVQLDMDKVRIGLEALQYEEQAARRLIPWVDELDEKGKPVPISSVKRMNIECRKIGLLPPPSTDTKDPAFDLWLDENSEKAPFVAAIGRWRSANRLLRVVSAMNERQIDGRLGYELKLYGAPHTRRWSGGRENEKGNSDSALNMHNLPRKGLQCGDVLVDVRGMLIPKPGHKFIISDLAQIQARAVMWLAKEQEILSMMRQGQDAYEAHARIGLGYKDSRPLKETNRELRQLAKAQFLGLQFQISSGTYRATAKQMLGMELSDAEASRQVTQWRTRYRKVVGLWDRLRNGFQRSAGGNFTIEYPSGCTVNYFDVEKDTNSEYGGWRARTVMGGDFSYFFGGRLLNNMAQHVEREILGEAMLKLDRIGIPAVLHVHDEGVWEVPENEAKEAAVEVNRAMSCSPAWATDMPLASDTRIVDKYEK